MEAHINFFIDLFFYGLSTFATYRTVEKISFNLGWGRLKLCGKSCNREHRKNKSFSYEEHFILKKK